MMYVTQPCHPSSSSITSKVFDRLSVECRTNAEHLPVRRHCSAYFFGPLGFAAAFDFRASRSRARTVTIACVLSCSDFNASNALDCSLCRVSILELTV